MQQHVPSTGDGSHPPLFGVAPSPNSDGNFRGINLDDIFADCFFGPTTELDAAAGAVPTDFAQPAVGHHAPQMQQPAAAAAATAARASLPLLREWLRDPAGDGQRLDIRIPALSQGGTMMAITGDRDGLSELRALVQEYDFL